MPDFTQAADAKQFLRDALRSNVCLSIVGADGAAPVWVASPLQGEGAREGLQPAADG